MFAEMLKLSVDLHDFDKWVINAMFLFGRDAAFLTLRPHHLQYSYSCLLAPNLMSGNIDLVTLGHA